MILMRRLSFKSSSRRTLKELERKILVKRRISRQIFMELVKMMTLPEPLIWEPIQMKSMRGKVKRIRRIKIRRTRII